MILRSALITGVAGQDGSYMADLLSSKGYYVVGTTRDLVGAKNRLSQALINKIELIECDLLDQASINKAVSKFQPQEIYNFAAYSSGAGMYDDAVMIAEINGLTITRILDAIRFVNPEIRFCQASSREVFGEAFESPQNELTPRKPRSPYGAAKLYADAMINIYRQHYGMFACSAVLFNHESPRRGCNFVTRKISLGAAKIKLGLCTSLSLGNLDTKRDWGFAGDYVDVMWRMLQHKQADDYVVSTGHVHSVREFCSVAFSRLGLDYQNYVQEDVLSYRKSEPQLLVGNSTKANDELGWNPKVSFEQLVHMMVDADFNELSRDKKWKNDV